MYARFPKDIPIVQKYGGTSVGSAERIRNVAARVARLVRAGHSRMAVVVSARAGETNRLVDLIHEVNPKASGTAYDMALAAGEQVSVALTTAALEAEGMRAVPLLAYKLGIMTDALHSRARILSIRTEAIEAAWRQGAVAVIAGFQGVTPELDLTTLGRGGSDTSAVALAVALKAAFCEINTDVDGVFTADPRVVKEARLLREIDYDTVLEMASLGSKVLHPRCVELGAKFSLPITVRNTFTADDHQRTCIMPRNEEGRMSVASQEIESLVVSGVTLDRNIAKVTVSGMDRRSAVITEIFDEIGTLGINVDIIVHDKPEGDRQRLGFTVAKSDVDKTCKALASLAERRGYRELAVESETGLAKVSVVGVGMHSHSGVAGRTFRALTGRDIDIHMISTSEIKISCVVADTAAEEAMRVLHAEFIEN